MPKQTGSAKNKLKTGVASARYSMVLDIKLVQRMKLIAIYDDTTEKDLYYKVMKQYVDTRKDVHYPDYLRDKNPTKES